MPSRGPSPSETSIGLVRNQWAGRTDHNLWDPDWVCSGLYRHGKVIRYKPENTKSLGVRFSALLTGGGTERLELARA
jgi:hypothetical protein